MGNVPHSASEQHSSMSRKDIWRVFFILLFVTVIEFIIALAIPTSLLHQNIKDFLYVMLTIVKAFYIVAYFMHMKYEKLVFQGIILFNMIFMIYFIILLLIEGHAVLGARL